MKGKTNPTTTKQKTKTTKQKKAQPWSSSLKAADDDRSLIIA